MTAVPAVVWMAGAGAVLGFGVASVARRLTRRRRPPEVPDGADVADGRLVCQDCRNPVALEVRFTRFGGVSLGVECPHCDHRANVSPKATMDTRHA